jgi:1,4-dihydroxy-2-naphthoate octaprenyltransferase
VVAGSGLAAARDAFELLPAAACLTAASLIQVGTNLYNDYSDWARGADTPDRAGETRVTQAGLLSPRQVRAGAWGALGAAVAVGTYLAAVGGWPIVAIGLASVLCAVTYTGGPWPFGYHGLGDLFVFVFFGLVAVAGTYYVQAAAVLADPFPLGVPPETLPLAVLVAALPIAALSTDILVVNNVRDREEDATTGKRTLAVRFGYGFARAEFLAMLLVAYAVPLWFLSRPEFTVAVALPYLTLPYAADITRTMLEETDGDVLNPTLERTGRLLAAYAVLFAVGLSVTALPL